MIIKLGLGLVALSIVCVVIRAGCSPNYNNVDSCAQRLRVLAGALYMYVEANDDHLPRADEWASTLRDFYKPANSSGPLLLSCRSDPEVRFAMNPALSGAQGFGYPYSSRTVLFTEYRSPNSSDVLRDAQLIPSDVHGGFAPVLLMTGDVDVWSVYAVRQYAQTAKRR